MTKNTTAVLRLLAAVLGIALLFAMTACADDTSIEEPQATPSGSGTTRAPTPEPTATPVPPKVSVVTTTNIMADWVENVGGDNIDVFSLVPVGADPHTFQPGAKDVARIADADLVLSVGLGLEGAWLKDLLENAARDPSSIVEIGEIIDPIEFGEGHAEEVELLEEVSHIVHEVEEGEISPETGLEELKELLESVEEGEMGEDHEGAEDGDEGDEEEGEHNEDEEGGEGDEEEGEHHEEELPAMVLEIIEKVEGGQMEAEDAIEAIEALTTEGEDEHAGHGHGVEDPHFWFDPLRVKLAVNDIAARLSVLDPSRGDTYRANASAYNVKLDELHEWTEAQTSTVPEENRLLVTSHDSFGYFAELYHFEVVGVVLSITTDVEPSAGDLADLVEEVKEEGVPAVFGETTVSERLAQAVASESGAELVRLYSGSLGPEGSGAATYIEMVRTNVGRIVEALK